MEIIAKKISKKSIFKLLFLGTSITFLMFFAVCGLSAFFGYETISVNKESVIGINGLLTAIIIWPIFSLLITGIIWLCMIFGLFVYSFFKPLKVTFKDVITGE